MTSKTSIFLVVHGELGRLKQMALVRTFANLGMALAEVEGKNIGDVAVEQAQS